MKQERIVLHIDMDAFFAAIEERNNPHLRGEPIIVGADPKGGFGRGVVSTANYEARKYGIRSAMPISEAYRRCPHAIFLQVDHELYSEVSKRIASILYSIEANGIKAAERKKLKVEQVSIDEFYIEARDLSWEGAIELAGHLKDVIRKNEQLTCSIGIGPNPFVAKVASDFKKPDGLTLVKPDEITRFLAPLAVRKIPGIGPKTEEILLAKNIKTIRDLRKAKRVELVEMFGKLGDVIYSRARGIDDSPVGEPSETKSIGAQETFETDTLDGTFLIERLQELCESVWERFVKEKFRPKSVVLTVRFRDFVTVSRRRSKKEPINSAREFEQEAIGLLLPFLDKRENPRHKKIRLLGIRGENLIRS